MQLLDEVRASCRAIAESARFVSIDRDAWRDPPAASAADTGPSDADAVLQLDAINFGSGWFPTLRKRTGCSGYFTVAWSLADRWRAGAGWTPAQLRAMRSDELAETLGQSRDHELMGLYAQALRELGRFLGERRALDVVAQARGSAQRLAELLAEGMTMWQDRGFYKRAQIVASDLALGGVAEFGDLDALTIFADNLVPHVLRCEGVLVYEPGLAAHIDAERLLRPGPQEREIRGCAIHACAAIAQRTGMTERDIDNALWYRGQRPEYKARPRHRCRTIYY
jgi:hypothetical protein